MIEWVTVVVPAADEEESIGDCLSSIAASRTHLQHATAGAVRSRVVVVLDACTDDTDRVVAEFFDVEAIVSTARRVGAARRLGASHALRLHGRAEAGWLASTDADCVVPPNWLTRMVEDAERGVDLVVGTVRPAPGLPPGVDSAWYAAHDLGDDHPHVHAANLGIAAHRYVALGGWRDDLACHEDADLVERAEATGLLRIRRSGAIGVVTSNRRRGRAPGGFANYLDQLASGLGEAS